jgi:hypothetical protein|tara:strand:- start:472 stop:642 length:171 start_codon:yes stop_codon:yes gene_type:complete
VREAAETNGRELSQPILTFVGDGIQELWRSLARTNKGGRQIRKLLRVEVLEVRKRG